MYVNIFFAVFFSFIAAYLDYKTGYIYDWLTYPAIVIGIALSIINSYFLYSLIIVFFISLVFLPLYYYGKIGGGDIKYFYAMAFILPFYKDKILLIYQIFFASVFASLFIGLKIYLFLFKKHYKKLLLFSIFSLIVSVVVFFILPFEKLINILVAIAFFFSFIMIFMRNESNLFFAEEMPLENLQSDDVIDLKSIGKKGTKLINKKLKDLLLKKKVKKVIVYRKLPPFAPFLFFALLFLLFYL